METVTEFRVTVLAIGLALAGAFAAVDVAPTAFIPVKTFSSSVLSILAGAEIFRETANIEFYESSINMVYLGAIWNHIKK